MKISKTVKLGLSIAVVAMFIGCGSEDDNKKETPNNTNQQENDNSSGDNNSNSGNSNNSEEEAGVKASTTPFIVKMKTHKNSDDEDVIYIGAFYLDDYNYSIDWGDGTTSSNVLDSKSHLYPNEGTYTISISGIYPRIDICPLSIEQWGDMQWSSMREVFDDCKSNKILLNATDTPNLSHVTDMRGMFYNNTDYEDKFIFNETIGSWDVSNITNMEFMFYGNENFNQDISSWNISNVTNMESMFQSTNFNQDISSWDVSNVTNMHQLFSYSRFNQDISSWNVSSVTHMGGMFRSNKYFNQDISSWDVSNVTDMGGMFSEAKAFNQNLGSWDISKVGYHGIDFDGSNLSTENYDQMLIAWLNNPNIRDYTELNMGDIKYSKKGQQARFELINEHSWTIEDGGLVK